MGECNENACSMTMPNAEHEQLRQQEKNLVYHLVGSEAFRRLQEVSFLGSVDYFNYHRSRRNTWYFSRSDHVRGVLLLAQKLIDQIDLTAKDRLYIVSAAICHDMGHSPFSHSSERAFKKINPHINHRIILDFVLNAPEMGIEPILSNFNLSSLRVLSISLGTDNALGWIFDNPINIDTLDGMLRFLLSFRLTPPFNVDDAVNTLAKLYNGRSADNNEVRNLDQFWMIKQSFYEEFLRRGTYAKFENAYIDLVLSRKKKIGINDYLKRDTEFAKEIGLEPDLYLSGPHHEEQFQKTHFEIDQTIDLSSISDLYRRYIRKRVEHADK